MIHKVKDLYVISSQQVWKPGVYEDERTANYAFRFKDEELSELSKKKKGTVIMFKDLQVLRKGE